MQPAIGTSHDMRPAGASVRLRPASLMQAGRECGNVAAQACGGIYMRGNSTYVSAVGCDARGKAGPRIPATRRKVA